MYQPINAKIRTKLNLYPYFNKNIWYCLILKRLTYVLCKESFYIKEFNVKGWNKVKFTYICYPECLVFSNVKVIIAFCVKTACIPKNLMPG